MGPTSSMKLEPVEVETANLRQGNVAGGNVQASLPLKVEPQGRKRPWAVVEKRHVCEVCDVAFLKPAHLRQHAVSHTGQRPYTCSHDGCSRSFKRSDHLRRHSLSHSHPTLECPIPGCAVTFTLSDNLRAHVKRHEGVHLRCSEPGCAFETAFKRQLWEHTRTAHEKRHACQEDGCEKVFNFRSLLAAHTASMHGFTANGTTPLVAAPRTSSLPDPSDRSEAGPTSGESSGSCLRAEEEATSLPGFACIVPGCNSHFRQRRSLKQHLSVAHLKETRYPCRDRSCSSSFFTEVDRAHHTAVKHPPGGLIEHESAAALKAAKRQKPDLSSIFDQLTYSESA